MPSADPAALEPSRPGRVPEFHEWMPDDYFRHATLAEIFPDAPSRPWEIDLGCGDGTFLVEMAARFRDRNFLGVERLLGRVRGTCRRAREAGLDNVRVLRLETAYTVGWLLPHGTASRVHLLFPDPWPKKKHARHRLFRPDFLSEVRLLLAPGGEFLFKTDHGEYAAEAREVVEAGLPGWQPATWEDGDFFYPRTDFEAQWLAQGKSIHLVRLLAI